MVYSWCHQKVYYGGEENGERKTESCHQGTIRVGKSVGRETGMDQTEDEQNGQGRKKPQNIRHQRTEPGDENFGGRGHFFF